VSRDGGVLSGLLVPQRGTGRLDRLRALRRTRRVRRAAQDGAARGRAAAGRRGGNRARLSRDSPRAWRRRQRALGRPGRLARRDVHRARSARDRQPRIAHAGRVAHRWPVRGRVRDDAAHRRAESDWRSRDDESLARRAARDLGPRPRGSLRGGCARPQRVRAVPARNLARLVRCGVRAHDRAQSRALRRAVVLASRRRHIGRRDDRGADGRLRLSRAARLGRAATHDSLGDDVSRRRGDRHALLAGPRLSG
jgi:hypothetical protein